jgi:hypothetical protein
VLESADRDRLGFDDRELFRHLSHAPESLKRILHVIQDAQKQDDVELPDGLEVHRHEVGDHRLDSAFERRVRDIEPPLPR